MSLRIVDNLPRFSSNLATVLHQGLGELAVDILVKSRMVAPFDKGQLRADSDVNAVKLLNWHVRYHKEYAEVQERGEIRGRKIRNYTTPGTKAHYLKDSGDEVKKKALMTIKKHSGRARV